MVQHVFFQRFPRLDSGEDIFFCAVANPSSLPKLLWTTFATRLVVVIHYIPSVLPRRELPTQRQYSQKSFLEFLNLHRFDPALCADREALMFRS